VTAALGLAACGATPTATPVPPTATKPPAPTNTPVPVPPTATKPAAAATAAPAAPTAVPPTAVPPTAVPPTATPAGPKVVTGGKVTIAQWNPPDNLQALNAKSSYAIFPVDIIYGSLLRVNEKLEFLPRIASKYEVSKDLTTYTFTIDPKAKWHDGTPVTAEDVEFTIWAITDPAIETNRGSYLATVKGLTNSKRPAGVNTVEGVKVVDKQTIQITLKGPADPQYVLEAIGQNIWLIPKHLLKDVAPADFGKAAFWTKPIGAGAFKFKQYQTDQFLELVRNDDYVLGKPNLDSIIIKVVPAASLVAQLEKGEIDLTAGGGIGEVPLDDWARAKGLKNIDAISYVDNGYQYIDINYRAKKPTNNKLFKQAITTAINRKLIVDSLLLGEGMICNAPIIPATPYYSKATEGKYAYDPAKAKQLLAESKFDTSYVLKVMVPTGNKVRELSADVVQANLQDIGIKVSIEKMEFATLRTKQKEDTWDLSFIGWGGSLDPDVSSQFKTGGQYNNGGWSLKAMDDLLDKGVATSDTAARKTIYNDFQNLFVDELPIIPLYWANRTVAVNKRVMGAKHMIGTFNLNRNIHEWWVTDGK
jgi:peptide/nickel transport system substrate-binding protein